MTLVEFLQAQQPIWVEQSPGLQQICWVAKEGGVKKMSTASCPELVEILGTTVIPEMTKRQKEVLADVAAGRVKKSTYGSASMIGPDGRRKSVQMVFRRLQYLGLATSERGALHRPAPALLTDRGISVAKLLGIKVPE